MGICCMTQRVQTKLELGNYLERWDGEGGERDVPVGGDIGKSMADSC